jgi:hypothetical protein
MCGKFDCIRKEAYLKAADSTQNGSRLDADMGARMRTPIIGSRSKDGVVPSDARVIHLHDLSSRYDLSAL